MHWWLLRSASAGLAVTVGAAGVLAATHGEHADRLWNFALVAVVVIAALTVAAAAGAYMTQPVSETHHASLTASAASLLSGLTSRFCDYGDGYNPEQAFRSHYGLLTRRLRKWDDIRTDAGERQRMLGEHLDAILEDHGVVGENYAVGHIRMYAMEVGLRRAGGDEPLPDVDWTRNWGTTAVEVGVPPIHGPREGWVAPYDGAPKWVNLPPDEDETQAEWRARAKAYTDRIDGLLETVRAGSLDPFRAVVAARQKVAAFQANKLPITREALQLIEIREPPRQRWRCKSC